MYVNRDLDLIVEANASHMYFTSQDNVCIQRLGSDS